MWSRIRPYKWIHTSRDNRSMKRSDKLKSAVNFIEANPSHWWSQKHADKKLQVCSRVNSIIHETESVQIHLLCYSYFHKWEWLLIKCVSWWQGWGECKHFDRVYAIRSGLPDNILDWWLKESFTKPKYTAKLAPRCSNPAKHQENPTNHKSAASTVRLNSLLLLRQSTNQHRR